MKAKTLLIELMVLVIIGFVYWLALHKLIDLWLPVGKPAVDMNLHDTYFVINRPATWHLYAPCLLVVAVIYLLKEAFWGYRRLLQNSIATIANLVFVIWLVYNIFLPSEIYLSKAEIITHGGWTLYPPLSALPGGLQEKTLTDTIATVIKIFTGTLITLSVSVLILTVEAFLCGKSFKNLNDNIV